MTLVFSQKLKERLVMTKENKDRLNLALLNAAELIRSHCETDLEPDEVNEESENGLEAYKKACEKASKMIRTLARKYSN